MELTLDEGHDAEDIPTIGLVAILVVDLAHIVTGRFGSPTLAVDILSAEGPLIQVILGREGITVLLYAAGLTCQRV